MPYSTVYDLNSQPPMDWRSLVLPFGLALAAGLTAWYTRPGGARTAFFIFALLFVVLPVSIQAFNYYYLASQKPQTIEGLIGGYWRKDWTTRRNGSNQRHSQEGFSVQQVNFWYNRSQSANFTNVAPNEYALSDGQRVRIQYVPLRQLDSDQVINAIVKLEIAETGI